MNIGIDCRALVGHRSGIGRYLYEILRRFGERDDPVRYFLYSSASISVPDSCSSDPRFSQTIKHVRPSVLWMNTAVPPLLRKDQIDVFWGPNYAMPLLRRSRCRYVVTIHDLTYARFPETMRADIRLHHQLALPLYARLSDGIITDSNFSKKEIVELLAVQPSKVRAIHLATALNPERLPPQEERDSYILTVGTVEPRKNMERLVEAYSMLRLDLRQKHRLVIAGAQGWGDLNPRAWFTKYGVTDTAEYMGVVSEEVLISLYRNASIFVFPSLYEGFGLPVLEAMSLGVPVISSQRASLPEVTGKASLAIDASSASDIADKMCLLLQDHVLRERIAENGVLQSSKFDWEFAAAETFDFLLGGVGDD